MEGAGLSSVGVEPAAAVSVAHGDKDVPDDEQATSPATPSAKDAESTDAGSFDFHEMRPLCVATEMFHTGHVSEKIFVLKDSSVRSVKCTFSTTTSTVIC